MRTWHPVEPREIATARPMPRLAPVTNAILLWVAIGTGPVDTPQAPMQALPPGRFQSRLRLALWGFERSEHASDVIADLHDAIGQQTVVAASEQTHRADTSLLELQEDSGGFCID